MPAFTALLRYDLGQLARSWLVRLWLVLLVLPAAFLVVVAASEDELASETMAAYIAAVVAPLSWLAVSIFSASAVAAESPVAADSILSRSVTRTEYLAAKFAARVGATIFIYMLVTIPFTYFVVRYAVSDVSIGGAIGGLLSVGLLLGFLAAFGIMLSVLLRNMQMAVVVALVSVAVSGVLLQFLGLHWMSTTAVLNDLPDTFRGDTSAWTQTRVIIVFAALTAAAGAFSMWSFNRKDL